MRAAAPAFVVAFAVLPVEPLPGLGLHDPRVGVDPTVMPWAAVARLNVPGVSRCSAVMIASHWAVTAAHCLYSKSLGHVVPPSAIHILTGYANGTFARHMIADAVRLPDGADPGGPALRGTDFALLHVAETVNQTLPPNAQAAPPGATLVVGGYGQDRSERVLIDPGCAARGTTPGQDGQPVLMHDCAATRGTSGGPVLMRDGAGAWRLAGLQIAAYTHSTGGAAVPAEAIARLLAAQR